MSKEILLANPILPPGYIDLSVGEPVLICDNLLQMINVQDLMPKMNLEHFSYPSPCGLSSLVQYLEDKHQEKVIITNGAKQALGAAFYAAKMMDYKNVGVKNPYWALIPELVKMHGLEVNILTDIDVTKLPDVTLAVSPNNPDGRLMNLDDIEECCLASGKLMIHDGVYYTDIYAPNSNRKVYGDVQIFYISKMFGLSSLRLGYAVCKNNTVYQHMQHYMEHMTVGVSKITQMFLMNIIENIDMIRFEKKCFDDLEANKKLISTINESVISANNSYNGMFLWTWVNNWNAFEKSKLHVIRGTPFGDANYVRLNLGLKTETIKEIVNRLNDHELFL